jgi:hypothetical protein
MRQAPPHASLVMIGIDAFKEAISEMAARPLTTEGGFVGRLAESSASASKSIPMSAPADNANEADGVGLK